MRTATQHEIGNDPSTRTRPRSSAPWRALGHAVVILSIALTAAGCSDGAGAPSTGGAPAAGTAPADAGQPDAAALATLGAAAALDSTAMRCGEENLSALREVWERYPADAFVRDQLRTLLEACMQWDGLAEVLEAKPEAERTPAEQIELAGLYLRHLGRFADAEKIAIPLAQAYPDDMNVVSLAVASLYYQDRVEEAVPMIDRLWEQMVAAKNTDIMTMRAVAFLDAGNAERAANILEQVIEFYPEHTFALTTLARARQELGDEAGAQAAREQNEVLRAEESLRTRQGQRMADLTRTLQAAWDAGEYEEVERIALRMLEIAPPETVPQVYRVLGDTYNELRRSDEARAAFEKAAELERALAEGAAASSGGEGESGDGDGDGESGDGEGEGEGGSESGEGGDGEGEGGEGEGGEGEG